MFTALTWLLAAGPLPLPPAASAATPNIEPSSHFEVRAMLGAGAALSWGAGLAAAFTLEAYPISALPQWGLGLDVEAFKGPGPWTNWAGGNPEYLASLALRPRLVYRWGLDRRGSFVAHLGVGLGPAWKHWQRAQHEVSYSGMCDGFFDPCSRDEYYSPGEQFRRRVFSSAVDFAALKRFALLDVGFSLRVALIGTTPSLMGGLALGKNFW